MLGMKSSTSGMNLRGPWRWNEITKQMKAYEYVANDTAVGNGWWMKLLTEVRKEEPLVGSKLVFNGDGVETALL